MKTTQLPSDQSGARLPELQPPTWLAEPPRSSGDERTSVDHGVTRWQALRQAPHSSDLRLSMDTVDWIAGLEPALRPVELALRHPRLANAICTLWPDTDATRSFLMELLTDRRGGRQGFSEGIGQELASLLRHCDWRLCGPLP